jgi:hypothetical protein
MQARTWDEAYKMAMAAGWDAGSRATKRGEDFWEAATETFHRVMAALGYPTHAS